MSLNTILATTPLTSTNYVLKATGTTIGNSLIFDNGTNVGIGNTNTSYTLDVSGSTRTSAVQPSLLINYTDATSYANLIFTESGVNKGIIQFIGSTFATTSRRNNLEIVNGANADMTFWTNNTTRMTISSAGNVGIGLTNPSFPLEVSSTTTTLLARFTSNQANAAIRIVNNSSNGGRTYSIGSGDTTSGAGNNFYIYDESNSALRFAINNSGNIGIGTSSPSYKLDVVSLGSPSARVRNGDLGGTATLLLETANDFSGTCQTYVKCIGTSSNGTSQLAFGTAGASGDATATERMRINSAGQVTMPYQPAFTAISNAGQQTYTGGTGLVFNNTRVNTGSHYNTSNGRFTAPVAGNYLFTYNLYTYSDVAASLVITINGSELSYSDVYPLSYRAADGTTQFTISLSIVLNLSASDYVQVKVRSGSTAKVYMSHSHFSGYLIG